jgi:hypothetical protein
MVEYLGSNPPSEKHKLRFGPQLSVWLCHSFSDSFLKAATIGHTVAIRYLVTGRHGRHKRTLYVDAPDLAVARSEALALAKFYGSVTENYTSQTWRLGAITVESEVEGSGGALRGARPDLRLML